jgi:hypothetical protein
MTGVVWQCPRCTFATTQPACVAAISHHRTPRSTRVTALQPITNQQPETSAK